MKVASGINKQHKLAAEKVAAYRGVTSAASRGEMAYGISIAAA